MPGRPVGVRLHHRPDLGLDDAELAVQRHEIGELVCGETAPESADLVPGTHAGEQLLGLRGRQRLRRPARHAGRPDPGAAGSRTGCAGPPAPCAGSPAAAAPRCGRRSRTSGRSGVCRPTSAIECASASSFLRPLPPAKTRTSAARRVDTSTTRSPASHQSLGEVFADPVAALDRPGPRPPLTAERAQFPEPLRAVRELPAPQHLALGVDHHHGVEPLVRVHTDHHLAHGFLLAPS